MDLVARIDHGTRVTCSKMMFIEGAVTLTGSCNGTAAAVACASRGIPTGYATG
jgi:hypothetical protein